MPAASSATGLRPLARVASALLPTPSTFTRGPVIAPVLLVLIPAASIAWYVTPLFFARHARWQPLTALPAPTTLPTPLPSTSTSLCSETASTAVRSAGPTPSRILSIMYAWPPAPRIWCWPITSAPTVPIASLSSSATAPALQPVPTSITEIPPSSSAPSAMPAVSSVQDHMPKTAQRAPPQPLFATGCWTCAGRSVPEVTTPTTPTMPATSVPFPWTAETVPTPPPAVRSYALPVPTTTTISPHPTPACLPATLPSMPTKATTPVLLATLIVSPAPDQPHPCVPPAQPHFFWSKT